MARSTRFVLRDVSDAYWSIVSGPTDRFLLKARLLWVHEQHQHLPGVSVYQSTTPLQRQLYWVDLQHIHSSDISLRHCCRAYLRCSWLKSSRIGRERSDVTEYHAVRSVYR